MRFYKKQHQFYCGVDLHTRMMYVCIVDQKGQVLIHQNVRTDSIAFLKLIKPYRKDLVVGVECMFTWYWLEHLNEMLKDVERQICRVYEKWPEAKRLTAIRGIALISAVSILARIGPVERFGNAEQLIAYAGLAPGVRQSDATRREGRIGGGPTDRQLRHYLIEASIWARQIPRYRETYERVAQKRGNKIGRIVVTRLLLRSIFNLDFPNRFCGW